MFGGAASPRDTGAYLALHPTTPAEFHAQELALMKSPGTSGCGSEPQHHPWEVTEGAKEVLIEKSPIPEQNDSSLAKGHHISNMRWARSGGQRSLKRVNKSKAERERVNSRVQEEEVPKKV